MKAPRPLSPPVIYLLALIAIAGCGPKPEGACEGRYEGEALRWPVDDGVLYKTTSWRTADVRYDRGWREGNLDLQLDLGVNAVVQPGAPHTVQGLESGQVAPIEVVEGWRETLNYGEYSGGWPTTPASRTLTIERLDDELLEAEAVYQWDGDERVTCRFRLPGMLSTGSSGGRPTPCGFHGC